MTYGFRLKDRSLRKALHRIACAELDSAIAALEDPAPETLKDRIHSARKSCKKLRALARLVRPGFADYSGINAALRDAARPLSRLRDQAVFLDTVDMLVSDLPEGLERDRIMPLRAALQHAVPDHPSDIAKEVAGFCARLEATRDTVGDWKLKGKDADILHEGLATGFARAQAAMKAAAKHPDDERMHAFRKAVKVHWYHARLFAPVWPQMIGPHCDIAGQLGEVLGLHRDLIALGDRLAQGDLPETSVRLILPPMRARMEALEREAFATARLLLAEPAGALASRWTGWWKIATR